LEEDTINAIAKPLTKMAFLCRYMDEQMKTLLKQHDGQTEPVTIKAFFNGVFQCIYLKEFRTNFRQWLPKWEGIREVSSLLLDAGTNHLIRFLNKTQRGINYRQIRF
jgi:hypothetical protein